jgi:hypothetical protein
MKFNIKPFLVAIISALVVIGTLTGVVQSIIPFVDPINELFFFVIVTGMFGISIFATLNLLKK